MSIDVNGRSIGRRNISRDLSSNSGKKETPNLRHRAVSREELSPTRGFCVECGERR